jgi:16S rRNA (cytidine1402-2'-O)-methyltransferase
MSLPAGCWPTTIATLSFSPFEATFHAIGSSRRCVAFGLVFAAALFYKENARLFYRTNLLEPILQRSQSGARMIPSTRTLGDSSDAETTHAEAHPAGPPIATFTAFGLKAEAEPICKGLHVVATPIGNLADISLRALATLASADAVVAEDARVTKTLLAHYGIATPLVSYHEHNAAVMRPHLIARLEGGAALALVSDAGTPLISDPGFKLVREAVGRGIPVVSVPGASAVLASLVVAGLPTDRFFFEGFLPAKLGQRRRRIAALAAVPGTLVFFESPRRVGETLADLAAVLGPREAAVARELTKFFETVRRGTLTDLVAAFPTETPPKGEIVILVGPPDSVSAGPGPEAIDAMLATALATLSAKDAAAVVSAETGQPRRIVYARAVALAARDR